MIMSSALGISLSDKACHAIVMHSDNEKYTWRNQRKLPYDFERIETLTRAILELKPNYQKHMRVVAGISSQKVITSEIHLSTALSDSEILQYILNHSQKLLGYIANDLSIDFEVQHSDDQKRKTIKIVATRNALIQKIRASFRMAKMPLHVIDVDAHAITRFNHLAIHDDLPFKEYEVAAGLCLWGKS